MGPDNGKEDGGVVNEKSIVAVAEECAEMVLHQDKEPDYKCIST